MKALLSVLFVVFSFIFFGCGSNQEKFVPQSDPVLVWMFHSDSAKGPQWHTEEWETEREVISAVWLDSVVTEFNKICGQYGEEVGEIQLLMRVNDSIPNYIDINHDRYVVCQKVGSKYMVRKLDWGPWNLGYERGEFKSFTAAIPTLVSEANDYAAWWTKDMRVCRSGRTTYQPLVIKLVMQQIGEVVKDDFADITLTKAEEKEMDRFVDSLHTANNL